MKLAIISPGFVPVPAVKGGAIEQLIEYIVTANELYHKYDIDLYTVDDPLLNNFTYKYTNLIKVPSKSEINLYSRIFVKSKKIMGKLLNLSNDYDYTSTVFLKYYKKNYYDAVLVENNMDIYGNLLSVVTKEKLYFHLHNDVDCGDPSKTKEKTEKIINTSKKILVVSQFLKKKLCKMGATNVTVVPNAIISKNFKQNSLEKVTEIRSKYGIIKNDFVFTFVGRLAPEKGIDKFISAIKRLNYVPNIKCLIVGKNFFEDKSGNRYISYLKNISQDVQSKLIFTGYIPNNKLNDIYSISNCVVIPSQWEEVFGVVALEAMEMKCPVIASYSGGLPEVLSKKCALFVKRDKNFIINLSDKMKLIMNDSILRNNLATNGHKRSRQFPQNESEYYKLISSVIK